MPSPYIPTPVSNMVRDYVRSMKALILNKDFVVTIWPNSNDQDDREAAEMGENFLRWLVSDNDEEHLDEKEKEAIWMIICGTAFDRTFPLMENDTWAFDASGNPINTGDVVSQHVSPFNVCLDSYGETLKVKRWVGIKSLKPREWVEDTFHIKLNESDTNEGPMINYEKRLAKLVANVSPWKGDGFETKVEPDNVDMLLFKEVEFRPTKDYPKGRYVGMVGDQICFEHDRLPIPVEEGVARQEVGPQQGFVLMIERVKSWSVY